MPDRIEAGTYMMAAALTQGNLLIDGINPKILLEKYDITEGGYGRNKNEYINVYNNILIL